MTRAEVAPHLPAPSPTLSDDASNAPRPHHFPGFNGLRAIAAFLVVALHTAWLSGFTSTSRFGLLTSRLEIGVPIFFLVSGFLLYRPFVLSHLTERAAPSAGRFWIRRILRIVPAYWLALTVLNVTHMISIGPGWQGFLSHYFFLQIYIPTQSLNGITQAWSLCTEVSFYLFLPGYAWLVGSRRRRPRVQLAWELVGAAVLYLGSLWFRYWVMSQPFLAKRHGHYVFLCVPHCATDPLESTLMVDWLPALLHLFALGMAAAVLSAWFSTHRSEPRWLGHPAVPWVSWFAAVGVYLAVINVVDERALLALLSARTGTEEQVLYGAFAALIVLPAVFGPQDRSLVRAFLRWWPVAAFGTISYGVYLWHLNIATQLFVVFDVKADGIGWWLLLPSVLLLSIGVASISYFALEKPILRYKGRFAWWDGSGHGGRGGR